MPPTPEAFLHPPLIRKLGRRLTEIVSERGGNVLASTHSAFRGITDGLRASSRFFHRPESPLALFSNSPASAITCRAPEYPPLENR